MRRRKNMNYKKAKPVHLPRVPLGQKSSSPQDDFWLQKGSSGAINAFRQLTSSLHKGGRKVSALPGGKLQPLFRNHSNPAKDSNAGQRNVLPHICGGGDVSHGALRGDLEDLPDLSPATIRVYMSSNYDDMKLERSAIMKTAVPKLQEYSSQLGVHFQLVDLHWGMQQDLKECAGRSRPLRKREIAECQRLSFGPNFVLLLGERYGQVQLPSSFTASEYELLMSLATEQRHLVEVNLLRSAYIWDQNNTAETLFTLQISSDEKELQNLQEAVHALLQLAVKSDKLTKEKYNALTMSALEEDIQKGILNTQDPRNHCLCYHREFREITNNLNSSNSSSTFVETMTDSEGNLKVNPDLHTRSQALSTQLMEHLGVGNCHNYYLNWSGGSLDEDPDFKAYLEKLCEDFVKGMKEMIDLGYKQYVRELSWKKSVMATTQRETLYHMKKVELVTADFTRDHESTMFFRVEKFFRDPRQNHQPFIIHAPSGCGKTTTIGALVKKLKEWFSSECVVAVRFLGSTWQSANIHRTVESVTLQICLAYNLKLPPQSNFDTLHKTMVTFRSVLDDVSKDFASSRPLFIVLDGIDQLHPYQECLKALWAIRNFPSNVHMVLSTTPEIGSVNLLSALVSSISNEDATLKVPFLSEPEIRILAYTVITNSQRSFSDTQETDLSSVIASNPHPLYVRLLLDRAIKLPSHDQDSLHGVPADVSGLINSYLDELENNIGPVTVTYFVSYISASPVGILEAELVDLLSNTKEVMDEVHSHHISNPDGIFLFPIALITKMKMALEDILEERLIMGKVAMAWKHREVYQAVFLRYEVVFAGIVESEITEQATSFSLSLHEQIANIFLPASKTELLCELPSNDQTTNSITMPTPQPISVTNLQLLNRLLSHLAVLLPVEGLSRVRKSLLFNFHWMQTKLQSCPLSSLMQDTVTVLQLARHLETEGVLEEDGLWEELHMLLHFLQLAEPGLRDDPDNLAIEVVARLPSLSPTFPSFQDLIEGAREHLATSGKARAVPLHPCLDAPGGKLRHSFPGATHVLGLSPSKSLAILFSQKNGVSVWRLVSAELEQHFSVNKEQSMEGVLPGNLSPFVVIGHYSHLKHMMEICAWSIITGVDLAQTVLPQKFEAIALSLDDQVMFLASTMSVENDTGESISQRCVMGINAKSKDIVYTMPCGAAHVDGIRRLIPVRNLDDDTSSLISVGGRKSKDLVCWNLEKQSMDCHVTLGYYPDIIKVNEEKKLGICCSKDDGVLTVVDLKQGEIVQAVENTAFRDVQDIYVTQSGDYVLLATRQQGVLIHCIPKGLEVKSLAKKTSDDGENILTPSVINLDETEHLLFVGFYSGLIEIYSVITGQCLSSLSSHSKSVNSLLLLEGDTLLSAADDQVAKLWHFGDDVLDHLTSYMKSGDEQFEAKITEADAIEDNASGVTSDKTFPSSSEDISCMTLSNDEKTLITGSGSGPIKIWDLDTGCLQKEYTERCVHGVSHLYLAYKGRLLIGHCIDPNVPMTRVLQVWQVDTGRAIPFEQHAIVGIYTSCVFPSDDRILTISPSGENRQMGIIVGIYDLFEMKCLSSLHCNIYGSMDCTNLQLLGFTSAPQQSDLDVESLHEHRPENTQQSLDRQDTSVSRQYAILDYFPGNGVSFFFTFVIHGNQLKDISMDHNEPIHLDTVAPKCTVVTANSICVSGTRDGSLVIWNAATQRILTDFCETPVQGRHSKKAKHEAVQVWSHEGAVTCLAATSDASHVVSGGQDGKVKVWNLVKKTLESTFCRNSQMILDVKLFPSGLLSTSSADCTRSVWDIHQQKQLLNFYAHNHVTDMTMATDKSRAVARVQTHKSTIFLLKLLNVK